MSQRRDFRQSHVKPPPAPFGAEDFTALVADLRAELAAADEQARKALRSGIRVPEAFTGRPWTAYLITLRDAAALAGYSRTTFKNYDQPAGRAAGMGGNFPEAAYTPGTKFRRWRTGDIALWAAGRPVKPERKKPAPAVPTLAPLRFYKGRREQAVAFLAAAVEADPSLTAGQAREACAAAGIQLTRSIAFRAAIMDRARAAALPAVLGRFAPGTDQMVTLAELAGEFGLTRGAVYGAIRAGRIRAVRTGAGWRADPARLRYPAQKTTTRGLADSQLPVPVDRDHPDAVPLPGDKEDQPCQQ